MTEEWLDKDEILTEECTYKDETLIKECTDKDEIFKKGVYKETVTKTQHRLNFILYSGTIKSNKWHVTFWQFRIHTVAVVKYPSKYRYTFQSAIIAQSKLFRFLFLIAWKCSFNCVYSFLHPLPISTPKTFMCRNIYFQNDHLISPPTCVSGFSFYSMLGSIECTESVSIIHNTILIAWLRNVPV